MDLRKKSNEEQVDPHEALAAVEGASNLLRGILRTQENLTRALYVLSAIGIVFLFIFVPLYVKSVQDEQDKRRQASIDNQVSICGLGQGIANALVTASGRSIESAEDQQDLQRRIDAFEADLEQRVEEIGCDFELIPAPAPTTTIVEG